MAIMGEGIQPALGIGETGAGQRGDHRRAQGPPPHGAVERDRLGHLAADAVQRVEAGHGFLEHHADLAAAQLAQAGLGGIGDVGAVDMDAPGDAAGAGGEQAQDGAGGERLAGAGFAHQRQDFAAVEREGDAVHHRARAEADAQVLDREQAHAGGAIPSGRERFSMMSRLVRGRAGGTRRGWGGSEPPGRMRIPRQKIAVLLIGREGIGAWFGGECQGGGWREVAGRGKAGWRRWCCGRR
jgi:hypothetical protein